MSKQISVTIASSVLELPNASVHSLVKYGVLADLRPAVEGRKHFLLLDNDQVRHVAKVLKSNKALRVVRFDEKACTAIRVAMQNGFSASVHASLAKPDSKPAIVVYGLKNETPVDSFRMQLNRIEEKVDRLLKIWS